MRPGEPAAGTNTTAGGAGPIPPDPARETGEDQTSGNPSPGRGESEAPSLSSGNGDLEPRLLGADEADRLMQRWHDVQAGFVDDPGQAVLTAADLLDKAIGAITSGLVQRREHAVALADRRSTEELRIALRTYRAVLIRLTGR